jgi:hypothetical protein
MSVTGSSLVLASNQGGLGEVCGPLLREFWLTPHERFSPSPAVRPRAATETIWLHFCFADSSMLMFVTLFVCPGLE